MSDVADLRDLPVVVPPVPHVAHPGIGKQSQIKQGEDKCTPVELRFIAEYLKDQDAVRAIKACKQAIGKNSAQTVATRWLARPRIAKQIRERLDRLLIAADVTAEGVLRELSRVAYLDPLDCFENVDGKLRMKQLDEIPERARKAIAGIKLGKERDENGEWVETIELKFWPKVAALESLAKRIQVLHDKFGGGLATGGDVHLHRHEPAHVTMYFPDNQRGPAGNNPTNRSAALTFRAAEMTEGEAVVHEGTL